MEPFLHLDGIRNHESKLDILEHLKYVLEQLNGMHNNLGYAITYLNDNNDGLIEKIEKENNVDISQSHHELDEFLQVIYKEINKLKE